ncbi:hypothetical protein GGR42_001621 [Saonia flava]|uniref:N-acetylglutamate synthase n=1 Tax=Saonia flava TaxID=523696 RepID=A0A846R2W4_9FLAO|nr:n-acetylglutamate synthase [Saonia flava]NJB71159.1 hypothetical protein [Saonia flava]
MNYNNKKFRALKTSENAEVSAETIFQYKQEGAIVTSEYSGGQIVKGHLIGLVNDNGVIDIRYHQINTNGELMTGKCISTPEIGNDGKIRLHEKWQWTSGDKSKGESTLIEL